VNKAVGTTVIVDTMHERKMKIYQISDAFLALPGGLGTLDELFEVLTWQQLGIHNRPVAILNIEGLFSPSVSFCFVYLRFFCPKGFFDPIIEMISSAKAKGFIRVNENRMNVFVEPEKVIDGFEELLKKTIEGNLKWLNTI